MTRRGSTGRGAFGCSLLAVLVLLIVVGAALYGLWHGSWETIGGTLRG